MPERSDQKKSFIKSLVNIVFIFKFLGIKKKNVIRIIF